MPGDEVLKHLPQQWVGIVAILMFIVYTGLQIVEKYPGVAKFLPGGVWWHERKKRERSKRVEDLVEDNEVVSLLQAQVVALVAESARQRADILSLQETVRAFTAWSVYDARYHHRLAIVNADSDLLTIPRHYDFFEFEKIWRSDPLAASVL